MATKPGTVPTWATAATYNSPGDAWDGDDTKVAPSAGLRSEGHEPADVLDAEILNHEQNLYGQWFEWFDDMFGADGEHSYQDGTGPISPSRVINVSPFHGFDATPAGSGWRGVFHSSNGYFVQAKADDAIFVLPLLRLIPRGAIISQIECMVTLGAARAGANRVQLSRFNTTFNWGTPSATLGGLASTTDDGGAAGGATVNITIGSLAVVPNSLTNIVPAFVLKAGNNASTNPDNLLGFRITLADPGLTNL